MADDVGETGRIVTMEESGNGTFQPEEGEPGVAGRSIDSTIRYELMEKVGSGGMGDVYKARLCTSIGTSEVVVLKKIRQTREPERWNDLLKKEVSILSELNGHPHIVGFRGADYLASGEAGEKQLFFVMEYVDGYDLRQLMVLHNMNREAILGGQAWLLDNDFAGFILFRIANALDYAHTFRFSNGRVGIAHMDLSPSNVLLNTFLGLVKLTDFGVAKTIDELTEHAPNELIMGKPFYISPELVRHKTADFTVDIYSMGVIGYQLLTGICPNKIYGLSRLSPERRMQTLARFQEQPLIPPHKVVRGADEALSLLIMDMMAYKRTDRIQTAKQLRDAVGRTIYDKGYGPTDHSFSVFLTRTGLYHLSDTIGQDRRKHGRRKLDQDMGRLLEAMKVDRTPLRLYGDAWKRYANGANPCREG